MSGTDHAPDPRTIERTIRREGGDLVFLDQRDLPGTLTERRVAETEELAVAIETLAVRGAPLIGVAAAWGVALAADRARMLPREAFRAAVAAAAARLGRTRPTAVNLFWALDRMGRVAATGGDPQATADALLAEAAAIHDEDVAMNLAIGEHGAALFDRPVTLLTHCNAGALATGGYGTALGVVRSLHRRGMIKEVYCDETRPLLQGARLTAFELARDGIPHRVITDGMAAHVLSAGRVDAVVTGADRIAGNGDSANKIGTHGLAVIAQAYGVPFYIAAPYSTLDLSLAGGEGIVIEERSADEVRRFQGAQAAPADSPVYNPAFDVTPARLIAGIVTERGVLRPPYAESLARAYGHG